MDIRTYKDNDHDARQLIIDQMIAVRNSCDRLTYRHAMHAITWLDHALGHLDGRPRWPRLYVRDTSK